VKVFFSLAVPVRLLFLKLLAFLNNRLPGTGKSVLVNMIIAQLSRKYRSSPDQLAITASTGISIRN
jgi:hypothetical protein